MDYTVEVIPPNPEPSNSKPKKKFSWRKLFKLFFKIVIVLVLFSWIWVIILKWAPIYFTPLMMIRKAEAYFEGKDTKIHYQWTSYENISKQVAVAVIASEDQRFPEHGGIDFIALKQAIEENKTRKKPRGASTISQQVAKNVFLWNGGGYFRKGLEAYFTYLIEWIWGKERILEVYLNIAEMGEHTFGVQAASNRFFKKQAIQINAYEAATLAAVLPNPIIYSAQNPSYYILQRRNQIVYQMQLLGGTHYLERLK